MKKNDNTETKTAGKAPQNGTPAEEKATKPAEAKTAKAAEKSKDAAQIEELKAKLEREHDDYIRLMAEFETFRRRSSEEKLAMVSTAAADTIKGLLPVLDDCERAMQMLADCKDESAKEGTALIYNKLMAYLKTRGLEPIEAKGQKFDTDFHEAVTQFPAPTPEQKGTVIDVAQTGYTLSGKVLRYAKVIVGA